jgi:hypothetical protein
LALTGYGYEDDVRSVAEAELSAISSGVEYRREALSERYVNDEHGLKQGFTLDAPPTTQSSDPLIL